MKIPKEIIQRPHNPLRRRATAYRRLLLAAVAWMLILFSLSSDFLSKGQSFQCPGKWKRMSDQPRHFFIPGWSSFYFSFLREMKIKDVIAKTLLSKKTEFSFSRLIIVPLSCHEVDGVRKEKERLTAASWPVLWFHFFWQTGQPARSLLSSFEYSVPGGYFSVSRYPSKGNVGS